MHLGHSRRMPATYPVAEARSKLGELARRAAQHECVTLTDPGVPVAVLISPAELEDLEDALAVARLERDRALGRAGTDDPDSVDALLRATDQLTEDERPEGSHAWGAEHRHPDHGLWRVLSRVDPQTHTLHIEDVGRTAA